MRTSYFTWILPSLIGLTGEIYSNQIIHQPVAQAVSQRNRLNHPKKSPSLSKVTEVNSLTETLRYVLLQKPSPHFLSLNEDRQVAEEEYSAAQADWMPSLSISAGYDKPVVSFVGKNKQDTASSDKLHGEISLQQSIFKGGGTLAGIEAAHYGLKVAEADAHENFQKLTLSIIQLYTALPAQRDIVENYEKNAANLRTLLEQSRARYKLGDKDITEVSASEAQLAHAEIQRDMAKKQMTELQNKFRDVVGCSWSGKASLPPEPLLPLPRSIAEAIQEVQRSNPILKSAMAQEKQGIHRVNLSSSARWPSVTAYAQYGASKAFIVDQHASDHPVGHGASVGVQIKWSLSAPQIFNGSKDEARLRGLRYKREIVMRRCLRDVKDAWDTYIQAKRSLNLLKIQVAAGEVTLKGIKEGHRLGSKSLIDVLYTEERNTSAKESLIRGNKACIDAAYNLLSTMGRLSQHNVLPLLK